AVPAASVPMRLPATVLFAAPAPWMTTPLAPLPEMTLPAAAVVPPMVFAVAPLRMLTPVPPLGRAAVPAALVPMKFPATVLFDAPGMRRRAAPLPEMTLPAAAVVPPMVFAEAPAVTITPWRMLATALLPMASVPTKLPWTRLPDVPAPLMRRPPAPLPE